MTDNKRKDRKGRKKGGKKGLKEKEADPSQGKSRLKELSV